MFSEIKIATIGVADLDRSIAFYADALGLEEISRTTVDFDALAEAWRIPAGIAGRYAVLGIPGLDSGMLRLVEWSTLGDPVWATPARFQDLGPHALTFRVAEIRPAWDNLCRSGAREGRKPTYWELEQNFSPWTADAVDNDGTMIELFEVVGEVATSLGPLRADRQASELQAMSIHSSDAKRSSTFYRGLGFEPLYDRVIDLAWALLGLPKGTRLHSVHLIMPGARTGGRLEISHHPGLPGRSLKSRTAPPARGPLMMSLRTPTLEEASSRLRELGAKVIGTAKYDSPPFGTVSAATFFGPDDEVLEVFETIS